jgi:AraC-like DNA-binding protein
VAVLQNVEHNWTVKEMAEHVNLSESRFAVLYREFFNTTPNEDLILGRIDKAKYLLTNKAVTVSEVADALGYQSVYHFIRQFRKRTGSTPGKFLRQ